MLIKPSLLTYFSLFIVATKLFAYKIVLHIEVDFTQEELSDRETHLVRLRLKGQ